MVIAYPDPEPLIQGWLATILPTTKIWIDPQLPQNWLFTAPIVHLQRAQGVGLSALTLDDFTLDVDVYAATADHARATAQQVGGAIELQLPRTTLPGGIFVKSAAAISRPAWTPDPAVRRRTAAYRIILHGLA